MSYVYHLSFLYYAGIFYMIVLNIIFIIFISSFTFVFI